MNPVANVKKGVKTSLHQLVDELLKPFLDIASKSKTMLTNSVSLKLFIGESIYTVASIINGILESVVGNASESNIFVSAKELYGKTLEVNIKDENCKDAYTLALGLQNVLVLAKKAGGQIFITHQRQKVTTVTFRFPLSGEELFG